MRGIYVETLVRSDLFRLWEHTQNPRLHERWDLRFTEISYLPRSDESDPQRFRYATRIGFGIAVEGEGESIADVASADGSLVSSLRFASSDPHSLIKTGSGYWRYVPTGDGIKFLTFYDYDVRFGRLGATFDRLVFRPLLGWATAWSFDSLRLWLEAGLDPTVARLRALAGVAIALASTAVAATSLRAARGGNATPALVGALAAATGAVAFIANAAGLPSARRCLRAPRRP
jgi:hypothetical protein